MSEARTLPPLIGMVHVRPLPDAPNYSGSLDAVIEEAIADAQTLERAGFDGLMVENFGDAPFFAEDVPDVTVAAMTRVITELRRVVNCSIGVNVLRNDALAAAAIAVATDADMIRVNVLSGVMYTDQGPIVGRAAELKRFLSDYERPPLLLADVFVKHASPPPGLTIEDAARDIWERGGADALVVSGSGTGSAIDPRDAERIAAAAPGASIVVGSGARESDLPYLGTVADSIIVGSALKPGGPSGAVDRDRAVRFVEAARQAGFRP